MFLYKTRDIKNLNDFNNDAKNLNSKIQIVLKFGSDSLRFTLSEALTSQEETDLDNLIVNFNDNDPSLAVPKIYAFAKEEAASKHFHNINYKKELNQSLIPKRTIVKGEVTQVDWYSALNASMEPENLIIRVIVGYTRDATGFATSRVTTRTWINEDGSDNEETKVTLKYYFINTSDMIDEGLKRRKLLVNSIQIPTLTFMSEALIPLGYTQEAVVLIGRNFMDDYETDFSKFIENSSTITDPADPNFNKKSIIVELENNDSDGKNGEYNLWLDKAPGGLGGVTTIRQYLISEFEI